MTLQASGTISLSNLQAEYGGSNPISVSEYYRGGAYVPNNVSVNTTVDYGWRYDPNNGIWRTGSAGYCQVLWDGSYVYYSNNTGSNLTSIVSGNSTYYRGNLVNTNYSNSYHYTWYVKKVSSTTTNEAVNTNVPTSGTVSLTQYYGGRKT